MTYSEQERLELKERIKRLYFIEKRGLIEISNILNVSHPVVKELIIEVKEEIREDYKSITKDDLLIELRLQFNEINKKAWIGFNEANDHRCKIGYLKIIQNNSQLLLELLGFNHNEVSREELIKFLKYVDEKTGDMESNPEELADDLIKEAEIVKIGNKMPREYDKVIDNWASEEEGLDEINNEQVISNS